MTARRAARLARIEALESALADVTRRIRALVRGRHTCRAKTRNA